MPRSAAIAAAVVAAVTLVPVVVVLARAAATDPVAAARFLWRPRVGELLVNTVSLVVLTSTACVVVGVAAAWLVERTTLPGRGWWRVLLVAPLAVPAFVNSYAWVSLRPGTDGLPAAVLVTTLSYYPFVFLPVAATLRGLDPALEDSARALGLRPRAVFVRVVVPQLRFAVLGGTLLVVLHLLAEYGALELIRFPTFTVAILEQYQTSFDGTSAETLAAVLAVLCLLVLAAEHRARGSARYARIGPGTRRTPLVLPLRRWTLPALAAVLTLVVLAVGVPVGALARWLSATPDSYSETPSSLGTVLTSAGTTIGLAAGAALLAVAAAFPVAWLANRRHDRISALTERATYLASALPGVVVGLALVTLTVRNAPALYQTTGLLLIAYVVLFVPRAVVPLRAALAQAPPDLIDAARALGARPWSAIRRVLVPLAAPGALAGAAMVFVATSTELTATLLLAPTGTTTLATGFWSASSSLDYAAAAPYAVTMVLLSLPVTLLLLHRPAEENQ